MSFIFSCRTSKRKRKTLQDAQLKPLGRCANQKGVSKSAKCGIKVKYGKDLSIDGTATVGHYTNIGNRVEIGPRSRVGDLVTLGDGVKIGENVCIDDRVVLPPKYRVETNTLVQLAEDDDFEEIDIDSDEIYELVDGQCREVVNHQVLEDVEPCTVRTENSEKIKATAMCGLSVTFGPGVDIGHHTLFEYESWLGDNVVVKNDVGVGAFAEVGHNVILEEGVCVDPFTRLPRSVRIKRNTLVRLKKDGDEYEYEEIPAPNGWVFVLNDGRCKKMKK